jgi:Family of unknown function (DUF5681)
MTKPAPDKTGRKQDGRFAKGASGNPSGRTLGSRHKTSILTEQLMQADTVEVVRAVIQKAKDGDMVAARIVVDRICPIRKGSPVNLTLPSVENASDIADAMNVLLGEMADGNLTPDETAIIAGILDVRRRTIETVEHAARLSELEAKVK